MTDNLLKFRVNREMTGDQAYAEGDPRDLLAIDAAHLVRSGALTPVGATAEKAMAELLGNTPWKQQETVVQQVKEDAPNNKAMGNAPANKGLSCPFPVPAVPCRITTGRPPGSPTVV